MKQRRLLELARLYGIQSQYINAHRKRQEADPQAILLVLRAMGAGVESFADVPDALARRKDELRKRVVEPVTVAWDGRLGRRKLEFGYHKVEIRGHETFVISAPRKACWPAGKGRRWGMFAPVYSIGDLKDFERLMDWTWASGGSVVATLPLLAAFLDTPFEPGPYSPASRLFWNEFYIDLGDKGSDPSSPKGRIVDYRNVMARKRRILEQQARQFFVNANASQLRSFHKFLRENPGVEEYARFRAVTDRQRSGWNAWPARLRDGVIRRADFDDAARKYHLYAQWLIQEQLGKLSKKAAARDQLLYLDLPLGLHADSYDVWRERHLFVPGVSGGAPPDPVFTKGQNWSFPPMHPEAMRFDHYRYVIAYLQNHLRYARLLRIDHVMGLHRLYWIPDELSGDKGVYVEYPAEELYAILSLESHRYQAGIVGENLGIVPPAVNTALGKHDIRGMYVVEYELMGNPSKPVLPRVPAKSVASLNTHDMPPFRGFLEGTDIADRVDLGFIDERDAKKEKKHRAAMRKRLEKMPHPAMATLSREERVWAALMQYLSRSMADIVLVNLEDLWGETLPQNVPSTTKERPNWRRRARLRIEQIRKTAGIAEVLSHVFAYRSRHISV